MTYSQYLTRISMILLSILFATTALVWYVDPYQIFHKSYIQGMGLDSNQRFQNAGLINSYLADPVENYDAVMIGSSVSDNFTSAAAAQYLGWNKSLRLFMDGGDPGQLVMILNRALAMGKIKHVLWEMPARTYSPPRYALTKNDNEFPEYLYNANRLDDLRYIFNINVLQLAWSYGIMHNNLPTDTPETLGYWSGRSEEQSLHAQFNSPERIKNEQSAFGTRMPIAAQEAAMGVGQFTYPVLDMVVFPVLDHVCNTELEVVLFIPPILKIDFLGSPKYVYRSIYMVHQLLTHIDHCHNIRLHTFDTLDFTGDLNNYNDKIHYRLPVSLKILEWMGKHQSIITLDNFEKYKMLFIKSIENYQPHTSYPAETGNIPDIFFQ